MGAVQAEMLAAAGQRFIETAAFGDGWHSTLGGFAEAAGAVGAVLIRESAASRAVLFATPGVAEAVAEYAAGKAPTDPRGARVAPRANQGFVTDFDSFSAAELATNPFYREFLRPRSLGWHACALLGEGRDGDRLYLSLKRRYRAGHYERRDVSLLNRALPALRSACRFAQARFGAEAGLLAETYGEHGRGVFAIDLQARAHALNPAAERLLERDLVLRQGRLAPQLPQEHRKLQAVMAAAAGREDVAVLHTAEAGRRLIVRAIPLSGRAREIFAASAALLLVDVWERPDAAPVEAVRALRAAFGMTPMEARVAALVARGVTLPVVAGQLATGEGTARNHLKNAMAKAEVSRQAELAALCARLLS